MRILLLLFVVQPIFSATVPGQLTDAKFADGLNAFSLEFLKKLQYENSNVIYSPLGLSMALGMLLEGAQGKPRDDLFNLLNFTDKANQASIHQKYNALLQEYKTMNTRDGESKRNATVELANLITTAVGHNLPKQFEDALKKDYEASVSQENFASNGAEVMTKINKFVKERTHDLIPQILSQPLSPATVFVLINTIFFKGFWVRPFDSKATSNETFFNADKSEKTVETMKLYREYFNYFHSTKLNAAIIELPYDGNVSMFVVLPDEKYGLPNLIKSLTNEEFSTLIENKQYTKVNLELPKFEFETPTNLLEVMPKMNVNLRDTLKSLDSSLEISGALHKAKIRLHEAGTEAAAVTIIHAMVLSAPIGPQPTPIPFKADHPFIFVIRDMKSNINLFCGTVNQSSN